MEEKEFFSYDDVKVTNARFIVGSQTYAMSNITSVKASEDSPGRFTPIACVVVGVACLFGSVKEFGIFLILLGGVWLACLKTTYYVSLTTAGGESKALSSEQREYIEKVVAALNNAIVHRG